ncbi:MAG: hypothetical protein JST54_23445 [Deltaproteobacteria bacterium]|nr:hypothetical protein [Deltaproteobacteria bacterium]
MSEPRRPPTFALPALLLHLAIVLLIVALSAQPLGRLWRAIVGPVSFSDEAASPAWLLALGFALALLVARVFSFARGRALPIRWTGAAIVAVLAVASGRALDPGPGEVAWTSVHDAPPAVQTAEVMKRVSDRIDAALVAGKDVPDDAALQPALADEKGEIRPNYFYRGLARRPFKLVRVPKASGPVDRKLPGDLAGTLYLAVAPDMRHYWLTGLVLLQDNGVRSSDLLPGPNGVMVVTNAATR